MGTPVKSAAPIIEGLTDEEVADSFALRLLDPDGPNVGRRVWAALEQIPVLKARIAALEADARRKEEALRELVSLKDLKDSLIADYVVNGHPVYSGMDEIQHAEYERRKPLAWAAARAALSQEPGGK